MTHDLRFSESAMNTLAALEKPAAEKIINRLAEISKQPARYTQKLVGLSLCSLKIGDYRVIMKMGHKTLLIFLIEITHKGRVYASVDVI